MDKSTKSNEIELSIILPAYNEHDNLELVVKSILDIIKTIVYDFEIFIVDDGSTDNTAKVARDLCQTEEVIFFQHHRNLGMGAAIKTGVINARFPFIIDIPCDNQFDARDIPKFINKIDSADVVVGYRLKKTEAFRRKLYSNFNLFLLYLFFGLKLKDPTWVKMFRKMVWEKMKLESDGFFWETEFLVKAKSQYFKIEQVPTQVQPRYSGVSKGNDIFRALDVFFSMLRFWFKLNFLKLIKHESCID